MDQFITATAPTAAGLATQPGANGQGPAAAVPAQPLRIQFNMAQIDIEFMVLMDEAQAQVPGAFAKAIRYLDARTETDLLRLPFDQLQQVMAAVNEQLQRTATRGN